MSADNMIYIQQRKNRWYVWMGFASDDKEPKPYSNSRNFAKKSEARVYAEGWLHGEGYTIEYGIIMLKPKL